MGEAVGASLPAAVRAAGVPGRVRRCGAERPRTLVCACASSSRPWRIRGGQGSDLGRIRGLVLGEAMNPLRLEAGRFTVAEDVATGRVVGCGQLREGEDVVEVRSLVVEEGLRGRGIGADLLTALLARAPRDRDVHLLTIGRRKPWYETHGFVETDDLPTLEMRAERCIGALVARAVARDRCLAMVRAGAKARGSDDGR